MAQYDKAILTNAGLHLLNEVMGGNGELEFCYLCTGSGTYSEEQRNMEHIRGMSALKEPRQTVFFSYIDKNDNGQVSLKANITNEGLGESYGLTELGIFAGKKGTVDKVLYCVVCAERPDFLPRLVDGKLYSIIFNVLIQIYDIEHASIKYERNTYALAEDLAKIESLGISHMNDSDAHITAGERDKWNDDDLDCGYFTEVAEEVAVALHNSEATSHDNMIFDGGNLTVVNNTITLEEHLTDEYAHQNIILDGGVI